MDDVGAWFLIIVVIGVIVAIFKYPAYAFAIASIVGVVWFVIAQEKKATIARRASEAERERLRQVEIERTRAHTAQQKSYKTELVNLGSKSLGLFEAMPTHLLDAESLLDQAEQDYKERAFVPFWESIQQATVRLGRFDSGVVTINQSSERYTQLVRVYEETPPHFPIGTDSVRGMSVANTTSDRMKAIIRKADCDHEFATIYVQLKTNQILKAGFTNLAEALDGMGRRIAESIDGLSDQISEMSSSLNSALRLIGEQIGEGNRATRNLTETVKGLHSTVQKEASAQTERHDRALEMLDKYPASSEAHLFESNQGYWY